MSTAVELYLDAATDLANRIGLPTEQPKWSKQYNSGDINTIALNKMLAQVAVLPGSSNQIVICGYGDEQMLNTLYATQSGDTLQLAADIPFKPGQSQSRNFSSGNIHISGGGTVFSSFSGGSFSMSSGGATIINGTMIINGREVDLDRKIMLVIMMPATMNVTVGKVIGAVGIADILNGELAVNTDGMAKVIAYDVLSFSCDFSGSVTAQLGIVRQNASVEASGSGRIFANSVGGKLDVQISGSARVNVEGGHSESARVKISGSGK